MIKVKFVTVIKKKCNCVTVTVIKEKNAVIDKLTKKIICSSNELLPFPDFKKLNYTS